MRSPMLSELLKASEVESVWNQHQVAAHTDTHKTIVHQDLGNIELDCQILFTENQAQALLVLTASPGSEGHEKLQLLSVIGTQRLSPELPEPLLLELLKA